MKLRYIYSACAVIETADVKILSDPWFTPGAYDGSWFQYPPLEDPLTAIGPVDVVYISHIHPDHYDPVFLKRYLDEYPDVEVVIGIQEPPYLLNKMRLDGFSPRVVETATYGGTDLLIVPNKAHAINVDTAMAVRSGQHCIVNMNDNPFDQAQIDCILAFCPQGQVDLALLPYAGAGPYPQTYAFATEAEQIEAAESKRRQFLDLFSRYIAALNAKKALPFAGKYWLGGRLARLNAYRGVPDAIEAAAEHPEKAVVLADGGSATYDLETGTATACRSEPYDKAAVERYLNSLNDRSYAYEEELHFEAGRSLPLVPLLNKAIRNARGRVKVEQSFWICIAPEAFGRFICFDVAGTGDVQVLNDVEHLEPRCEISIDDRYLFGLLTRLYHWNNATIGSQYACRRVPNVYRQEVHDLVDFLHV